MFNHKKILSKLLWAAQSRPCSVHRAVFDGSSKSVFFWIIFRWSHPKWWWWSSTPIHTLTAHTGGICCVLNETTREKKRQPTKQHVDELRNQVEFWICAMVNSSSSARGFFYISRTSTQHCCELLMVAWREREKPQFTLARRPLTMTGNWQSNRRRVKEEHNRRTRGAHTTQIECLQLFARSDKPGHWLFCEKMTSLLVVCCFIVQVKCLLCLCSDLHVTSGKWSLLSISLERRGEARENKQFSSCSRRLQFFQLT